MIRCRAGCCCLDIDEEARVEHIRDALESHVKDGFQLTMLLRDLEALAEAVVEARHELGMETEIDYD